MTTAQSILVEKGYDNFECMDIIQANEDNLDMKVREKYGVDTEPLHLEAEYYIGDADEDNLLKSAKEHGFEEIDELLAQMDSDLLELAREFPDK